MNNDHDTASAIVMKTLVLIAAWFGTIKLADVQLMVSILSGLAVFVVAVLNARKLMREGKDKP